MTEQEQALQDRLTAENSYLLARLVEMETRLNATLDRVAASLDNIGKTLAETKLPRFLKVEQVAELFQVSPSVVYKWVADDLIPHRKAVNQLRFNLEEIEAWTVPEGARPPARDGKKGPGVVGLRRSSAAAANRPRRDLNGGS